MLITVDFLSDSPIYIQIYEQIVFGIAAGSLCSGESLPSVRRLAEDIGVNLHTVNKAYRLLSDDGYIRLEHRTGAQVVGIGLSHADIMPYLTDRLRLLAAQAVVLGMSEREFANLASEEYRKIDSKRTAGK